MNEAVDFSVFSCFFFVLYASPLPHKGISDEYSDLNTQLITLLNVEIT